MTPRWRSCRSRPGSRSARSRGLESSARRPTLELLLPLARAHQVTLDELVDAPATGDPRVHLRAVKTHGMTMVPLTRRAGGIQAYKLIIPVRRGHGHSAPQTHEGYEWLYVLNGRLRLRLAEHDVVLEPGEAPEFDTRVPLWFGPAGDDPVEVLSPVRQAGGAGPPPGAPEATYDVVLTEPRELVVLPTEPGGTLAALRWVEVHSGRPS